MTDGGLRAFAARRVGVDLRALAAFRVSLALLVLADLALRSRSLDAFYTDAGVLPRDLLFATYPTLGRLSLHALSGAAWFEWALFALTAACALALLVGYRTTLATLATGALVLSLQYRNPLVLNGGDTLLRMLFLWSVFLPLGARWSVDALRNDRPRRHGPRIAGVASAGLLLQVLVLYGTNAALKLRGDAWLSGEAVRYVFSLEMFRVGLGDVLVHSPELLAAFSHLWLALLVASPLLVLLVGWPRAALVGAFAAMHLGMFASMRLGLFPLISVAALLPFLPSRAWDALPPRTAVPGLRALPAADWQERVARSLPLVAVPATPGAVVRWKDRLLGPALAVLLAGLLVWNAATVGWVALPDAGPVRVDDPEPRWGMFAPRPVTTDRWFVAPGTLAFGERVDTLRGGPVEWDKPPDVAASYPTARWRKYLVNVERRGNPAFTRGLADYLCGRWNGDGGRRLLNVSVWTVEQPTRLSGPEPTRRVKLGENDCGAR